MGDYSKQDVEYVIDEAFRIRLTREMSESIPATGKRMVGDNVEQLKALALAKSLILAVHIAKELERENG